MQKQSKCTNCSYTWLTGLSGSHSCVEHLRNVIYTAHSFIASGMVERGALLLEDVPGVPQDLNDRLAAAAETESAG